MTFAALPTAKRNGDEGHEAPMLDEAIRLSEDFVAVHWLRPNSKAPVAQDWPNAPRAKPADLRRSYRNGYNLGIRLGEPSQVTDDLYLYVIDVDVKGSEGDADEAHAYLDEILPEWETYPFVRSGGGGHGQHIYFFSEKPMRGRKLAHSTDKITKTSKDGKHHKHWRWEVELFGSGKQVAAPPSTHPDTGQKYRWGKRPNFSHLDIGVGAIVASADVKQWGRSDDLNDGERSSTREPDVGSSDSLMDVYRARPLGIDYDQAEKALRDLDDDKWCDDREGWIKTGMALNHEFGGDPRALEIWIKFSARSSKFVDGECEKIWAGFGKDKYRRPVRFATIIAAGATRRLNRELSMADCDDDMERETDEVNDDIEWRKLLTVTDRGQIKGTAHNVNVVCANDPRTRGIVGYNAFTSTVVFRRRPGRKIAKTENRQQYVSQLEGPLWQLDAEQKVHGRPVEDSHISALRIALQSARINGGYDFSITKMDLNDAIDKQAHDSEFHPVKERLESLEWDGVERLDTLFIDWLGATDTPYHRQTAAIFCLAAIARIYTPGAKFDCAPILEGPQGIGKSTFIQALALNWFCELSADLHDPKACVEALMGHWIAELPELSQFGRSDVESVKAFFSRQKDVIREAYTRRAKEFKRQAVFMGSTNNSEYLRDDTGARRFWPIKCNVDRINVLGFKKQVDQIWAEALERYRELREKGGANIFLDLSGAAATDEALGLQASRRVEDEADVWAGLIAAWGRTRIRQSVLDGKTDKFDVASDNDPLVRREFTCALEVWIEVLGGRIDTLSRGNSNRVVTAINRVPGVEKIGVRARGKYGKQMTFKLPKFSRTRADLLGE